MALDRPVHTHEAADGTAAPAVAAAAGLGLRCLWRPSSDVPPIFGLGWPGVSHDHLPASFAASTAAHRTAGAERRAALVNAGGGANRAHSREQRRTSWHSTGDNPEPRQRVRIRQRKTPRRTPLRPSCPARQALPGNRTSEVVDGLATD